MVYALEEKMIPKREMETVSAENRALKREVGGLFVKTRCGRTKDYKIKEVFSMYYGCCS